jgi:DNA polymerase III epsilon subunit-like protein
MGRSMIHLNGDILCSIDCETTGLVAGFHDLIQICILPLDAAIRPVTTIPPFYTLLQMKRPDNVDPKAMKVNGLKTGDIQLNGLDPWRAADLLEEWIAKLDLDRGKKISPLAQNWAFDKGFITDWLGGPTFDSLISYKGRDTMTTSLYLNDRADHHVEPVPFAKNGLKYLCSTLKVENTRSHDALQDCISTAEVYRRMLTV